MDIQGSIFAYYENFILKVARIVLALLATLTFIATIGAVVWLAFFWIVPVTVNYKNTMVVPPYETIGSNWTSTPLAEGTREATNKKLPPVLDETVEIVDSLYQLVGREERKFSENEDVQEFYTTLVEPFGVFDRSETFTTEFLIELKWYAQSMAKDELLKRIADVEVRTTAIVDSIFQFRDKYITNLHDALATAEARSATHISNRMMTSFVVLQILSICMLAFVVSAICLLGFHIATRKHGSVAFDTIYCGCTK